MITAVRSHRLRCMRSAVSLSAEVKAPACGEYSQILNLSGSGCLLETERPLAIGEVVMLRFSLPGMKEVETEARVARVSPVAGAPRSRGLGSPALVTPARPSNEDGSMHEQRFVVGVAFTALTDRESELIATHVVRELLHRRAA